ncbi:MAG: FecR domain-containing protein [Rhodoferax sp.]|nr:FecR domain-containing protein [Rhodoferax sp.]
MNPTNPFWRTLTACACLAVPLMAHTQASAQAATPSPVQAKTEPVGFVKTVTGQAWVNTSGQSVAAQPGTPVLLGSQLKTAKGAAMGIAFKDNTLMSFGPDTELTVDEFVYAPAQGQLLLGTRLSRGSLNYVSGVIAKLRPDAVTVKTPAGIIGVRGTQFVARVEEAQ